MLLEIIVALLVVLLLLILFVSFHVLLVLDKQGKDFQYRILIKWLFISYSLKPERFIGKGEVPKKKAVPKAKPEEKVAEKPVSREEKREAEEEKKAAEPERWNVTNVIKLLRLLTVPVIRLLEGILEAINIHKLKLDMKFGLADPADTGMAIGYLYALRGYLEHQYERVKLYAEPDFVEMMLDFNVIGDVKFRIANLLPAILKFIFNRDVLRVSWALIRKKDIPDPS
ncbi:DUF2953 domain-containing protein [Methanolobus sp. ZRKC2]|uniref:DUF2953 domain-containing protein n=1 Tax=Methanolobus sp. ZRKC2 TaxID=3125783 RepID=UPI0032565DF5